MAASITHGCSLLMKVACRLLMVRVHQSPDRSSARFLLLRNLGSRHVYSRKNEIARGFLCRFPLGTIVRGRNGRVLHQPR